MATLAIGFSNNLNVLHPILPPTSGARAGRRTHQHGARLAHSPAGVRYYLPVQLLTLFLALPDAAVFYVLIEIELCSGV